MEKYFTLNNYKDRITKEGRVISVFGDIEWEGETPYLILDSWGEFQELFHSEDRDFVERVLGEDWGELYNIDRVDFIDEVWSELDEKSLQHIKDYIKDNGFIGRELDYDEDPDGGGLREDMLEDNDLLGELINDEDMFDELKRELSNFYIWAYEGAAEDELFKSLKDDMYRLNYLYKTTKNQYQIELEKLQNICKHEYVAEPNGDYHKPGYYYVCKKCEHFTMYKWVGDKQKN